MKNYKIICSSLLLLFFAFSLFSQEKQKAAKITLESIQKDVGGVSCKNSERLDSVKKLFMAKGATEAEIEIIDYKNVKNIVVTKQGKTDEIVVVGAHFDKTANGCGAIDNWTGIVIVANLFKRLKPFTTQKTYKFVGFGREEEGLIGSRAMVKKIPKEERVNYCSMVNFDSFGLGYPQALANASTKSLIAFAEETADSIKLSFTKVTIPGANSDSYSFKAKKIPAITLSGLNQNWQKYLHTPNDKLKNINYSSVFIGYNMGLRMLVGIDTKPCQTFRGKYEYKKKKKDSKKK